MTTYTVTLVRSPGITEVERRRRINRAFALLLGLADEKNATPDGNLGGETSGATNTSVWEDEMQCEGTEG